MIKKLLFLTPLLLVLIFTTPPSASAKTRITISGAYALLPMMQVWADEYQKLYPDIQIDVSGGGAGKGATDCLGGMVDIGMISREAQPDELEKGGIFFPVAKDAVVPTINAKNPVLEEIKKKGINHDMFIRLFIENDVKTWGEVVGTDAKQPVKVYTRSDSCGAAESWAKYLGGKKQENLKGVGVSQDPGLLKAVMDDPNGIGYNNYSYVFDMKTGQMNPGVWIAYIDINGNGAIDNDETYDTREKLQAAIKSGFYPHPPARPLYLMTKGNPQGPTKNFILWVLTDGQNFIDSAGYMKVPEDLIKKHVDILSSEATPPAEPAAKPAAKSTSQSAPIILWLVIIIAIVVFLFLIKVIRNSSTKPKANPKS